MKPVSNVRIVSRSPRETRGLGRALGKNLQGGEVILLRGDLGTGKTVFAKGVATGLGVKKPLKSPSFGILQSYPTHKNKIKRFHHLDLYRLKSKRELQELGLSELLASRWAVTAIEWPEKIKFGKSKNTICFKFSHGNYPQERIIHVA